MKTTIKVKRVRAKLSGGKHVTFPVWHLDSGKPGPCLLLTAAQHGNEVQGTEAMRRFVEIASRSMRRGSVRGVPFTNLPAVRERRPHIRMGPEQPYGDSRGHQMNAHWPGDRKVNDTARLAHAVYSAVGEDATHLLDLHCWEGTHAAALIIVNTPELREIAGRLGCPYVRVREYSEASRTLTSFFHRTGRVGMTYECSGQYEINERETARCLNVVVNYAKAIGLLPGRPGKPSQQPLFSDEIEMVEVKADRSGLFCHSGLIPAETVRKGDALGHILSDRDLSRHVIKAPAGGFLTQYGASRKDCDVALHARHPYVTRGDTLAVIAVRR